MKKQLLSILLVLMMVLFVPAFGTVASALDAVSYRYPVYNKTSGNFYENASSGIKEWKNGSCTDYILITSTTPPTTWGESGKEKWYVVDGTVTISQTVTCVGNVHLILKDGANLTVNGSGTGAGINVSGGNSFTIYAQSTGSGMGQLKANGGGSSGNYGAAGAAIGGNHDQVGNNITINGGNITAISAAGGNASGIGGGYGKGCYNIAINGGIVTATSSNGSGIGAGYNFVGEGVSNIVINGGTVTATGGSRNTTAIGGHQGNYSGNIKASANVVVKAGNTENPTDIVERNASDDLASIAAFKGKRYVVIKPHTHTWSYVGNGAVLTATCSCNENDEDCIYKGKEEANRQFTLTVTAPNDLAYNGSGKTVTVGTSEEQAAWRDVNIASPTVKYYNESAELPSAPKNVGTYTAKVFPAGSQTTSASIEFTITKKQWTTTPTVSVNSIPVGKYSDAMYAPTNSSGITEGVTYYFKNSTINETEWTANAINDLPSGQYYLYAKFAENDNMAAVTTEAVPFTIHHVHDYTYEIVAGTSNKIKATCSTAGENCNDAKELVLKIDNAVYTGEPYDPAGVTRFIQEVGDDKAVTVTYKTGNTNLSSAPTEVGAYSATLTVGGVSVTSDFKILAKGVTKPTLTTQTLTYNGNEQSYSLPNSGYYQIKTDTSKGTNVGSYDVVVELKNKVSTCWADDNEAGTDDLTFKNALVIEKKQIAKPTAGTRTYYYNGNAQTYSLTDSVDSADYQITEGTKQQTNAGSYSVVVELKDKTNTCWNDKTSADLTFADAFTIQPLKIPVPVEDPRDFVFDGSEKNYQALYKIGYDYYNFDNVFYQTANNKRTNTGTQTVSVTPTSNYVWEDGTGTAAKTHIFTVKQQEMYARIYYLKDKTKNYLTDGFTYGYYGIDDENGNNLYVKNYYTPNLWWISSTPANANITFYVCKDPNNKSESVKWDDLKFTDSMFKFALLDPDGVTCYVYAKITAPGYADYETQPFPFVVNKPRYTVDFVKQFSYQVTCSSTKKVGKFIIGKNTTETRTKLEVVRAKAYVSIDEALQEMYKGLDKEGCYLVRYSSYNESAPVVEHTVSFKQADKDKLLNIISPKHSSNSMSLLHVSEPEPVEELDLSIDSITGLGISTVDKKQSGPSFDGYPDSIYSSRKTETLDFLTAMNEEQCESGTATVKFNLRYSDVENVEPADMLYDSATQTIKLGSTIEKPSDPIRSGFTFAGWYYLPYHEGSTTETVYSIENDGVQWDFENGHIADNMTLYALWNENSSRGGSSSSSYKVSVVNTENGTVTASTANANTGNTVTLEVAPAKGWTLETITVTDEKGNDVVVTAVKEGEKFTFKMPNSNVNISATFMEDNTMLNYFFDVFASDYYCDAVLWAAEKGITDGVDEMHFDPKGTTTRSQMVTFLWRAAGCPESTKASEFADVKANSYYEKAVAWAAEQGITDGVSTTEFAPDASVTRAQVVTFLARYEKAPQFANMTANGPAASVFNDVSTGAYYYNAILWAKAQGITDGVGNDMFAPNETCTRGQVVTFLYRDIVK